MTTEITSVLTPQHFASALASLSPEALMWFRYFCGATVAEGPGEPAEHVSALIGAGMICGTDPSAPRENLTTAGWKLSELLWGNHKDPLTDYLYDRYRHRADEAFDGWVTAKHVADALRLDETGVALLLSTHVKIGRCLGKISGPNAEMSFCYRMLPQRRIGGIERYA